MKNNKDKCREIYLALIQDLKDLREVSKFTLAEIAEKTGYSPSMISRFENGLTDSGVLLAFYFAEWGYML